MTSAGLRITALATQMKTTLEAIRAVDHESAQRCRTHADYHLLAARPGAGPGDAARLTAAMGPDRDRWTTGDDRLCFAGIAPVMERRGKSTWIRGRYCCPQFRRPSCHAYAGASVNHSCWASAYDLSPRARGTRHQAAVRALAFTWIRISSPCWHPRTPDREVRYVERLRKKGAPLLAFAAHHPS